MQVKSYLHRIFALYYFNNGEQSDYFDIEISKRKTTVYTLIIVPVVQKHKLSTMQEDQAEDLLRVARNYTERGNFKDAFELYLKIFKFFPQLKTFYEDMFFIVFKQLISTLDQSKHYPSFFKVYKQARLAFPSSADIIIVMGEMLLVKGCYLEAWKQFQAILDEDNSNACAEYHINEIKHKMVQRWHYRMLNDKTRNDSYRKAIHETVRSNEDSVLDVGSGTAILAMYAAESKPVNIVGIESNKTLFEISEYLLNDNNLNTIKIINNWSYLLNDLDIGGRKSLLVTELFDSGLLGEGVIQTLDHAFKKLLLKNGRVLPNRAEFFVQGIKSDTLMKSYYLNEQAKVLLNIHINEHVATLHSTYDCDDIHLYKDLSYVTGPKLLLTVDFSNPEEIEKMLSQIKHYSVELNPMRNTEVSSIIGWFNLHLTDTIFLTTDPSSENKARAWQQAVYTNFIPKQVKENDPFTVKFEVNNGAKIDLIPDNESTKISNLTMQFLNDETYMDFILRTAEIAHNHLKNVIGFKEAIIADFSPFPLFGLLMLKRGAKLLYCTSDTKESQTFFEKVFDANDINKERYKIIQIEKLALGERKFHAIFVPMTTGRHIVYGSYVQNALKIKALNLFEGGLFLPFKITIIGQVIHSPWLNFVHRVNDDNVGYKIAHQMNKFQLSADYYVNLNQFEYIPMTDPVVLGVFEKMQSGIIECPVLRDGTANAILCWYDIELLEGCGQITTKRMNSFINAMVFLADPEIHLHIGSTADIICCVDNNHGFKFILDTED